MKMLLFFTLILRCCISLIQAQPTVTDWQSDLRFLQTTVHGEYPFLLKKITAKDFDAQVEKLYQDIPKLQPHEILVGFGRIVSAIKYGHTSVIFNDKTVKFHRLPVQFMQFSDGVYLQAVTHDYPQAVGAKVLKIENMTIEAALKALYPVVPAENSQFFKAYSSDELRTPEILHAQHIIPNLTNKIKLTLEKEGKIFDQVFEAKETFETDDQYGFFKENKTWLDARNSDKTPLYLKHLDKIYFFEYLPDSKTVYIRHSQIEDDPSEDIPTFYARVFDFIEKNDVEKLVLDVRLNGGGNNYKNKAIVTSVIKSLKINQKGKFFVILGARTFSACQNLVNELHTYTNAIFIGEPTGENINFYGDNRHIELPKTKVPVRLSFAWWQDKPQWENDDWLAPNLPVEMSFDDYRSNRDPVLDVALRFSDKNFITDPMAHLFDLFQKGNMPMIETETLRFAHDPRYRYQNLEEKLTKTGGRLIEQNQVQSGLFVLDLVTKAYPKSAKAWLALAKGLEKANQPEKAALAHRKVGDLSGVEKK
jgi:hypothetical protein